MGNEEQRQVYNPQVSRDDLILDASRDDLILANAVQFLIDGDEEDLASILLSCSLTIRETDSVQWRIEGPCAELIITVVGPRAAYDILYDDQDARARAIRYALEAVLPDLTYIGAIILRVGLLGIDANWRAEMLERVRGKGVDNQGGEIRAGQVYTWKNLRFRSQSEVRIAEALEGAGVLFLPNCMAHLLGLDGPENKEADFLVCHHGNWGILEVDGEPFHPPSRVALDHARDRLFRAHGIKVVEHFNAKECYYAPYSVVERFLEIVMKA